MSLESKLKGRVSPFDTSVTLDITDSRVELADVNRKNLQSLEVPADVVLVDGRPAPQPRTGEEAARADHARH